MSRVFCYCFVLGFFCFFVFRLDLAVGHSTGTVKKKEKTSGFLQGPYLLLKRFKCNVLIYLENRKAK